MKKILASILVIMLLLGCILLTASCGKKKDNNSNDDGTTVTPPVDDGGNQNNDPDTLSGTYYDETGEFVITFEGNTITQNSFGMTITGTYTLGEGTITIYEEGEEPVTVPFEKGDGYIVIDDMRFTTTKPEPQPGLTGGDTILSGTYYDESGTYMLVFSGNDISVISISLEQTLAGTYKIENNTMTVAGAAAILFQGENIPFTKGDGYITISGEKFTTEKPEPEPIILSGTYYHETEDMAYTFEGNRFTLTGALTFSGTYYIEDGFMHRTRDGGYEDTVSFEMGDGYILLSGVKYTTTKPEPVVPTLDGIYYCEEYGVVFTFDNGSFIQTEPNGNEPYTGTYTIDDGTIFFDYAEGEDLSVSIVFDDGCVVMNGDTFNKLVNKEGVINGTWHNSNQNATFTFEDGSLILNNGSLTVRGTYVIENGQISIHYEDREEPFSIPLNIGEGYIMLSEDQFDRVTDTPSVGKNHAVLNGTYGNETMTITFEGNQYTTTLLSGGTGAIGTYEIIDSYIVLTPDNGVASPALVFERGSDYISVAGEVYNKISAGTVFEGDLQLSGTYTANINGVTISFVFNGDNFETKVPAGLPGASGTYVIDGGSITITYVDGTEETHTFEYGGSYIKLDSDVFNSESSSTQSTLDGTYFFEEGNITLILSNGRFSMTMNLDTTEMTVAGTFSVSDGMITLTPDDSSLTPQTDTFVVGDGCIIIGGKTYVKLAPTLDGTYSDGIRTITFDNGNFSLTRGEKSMLGTYVVSGDTVTLAYSDGVEEELSLIMGEGYIILGGIELQKLGGIPNGTYSNDSMTMVITGNSFSLTMKIGADTLTQTGTYTIADGTITLTYSDGSVEGPLSLEIGDGYIIIENLELTKTEGGSAPDITIPDGSLPGGLTGGDTILDGTYYTEDGMAVIFKNNIMITDAAGEISVGTYKIENGIMYSKRFGYPSIYENPISIVDGTVTYAGMVLSRERPADFPGLTGGEILDGTYTEATGEFSIIFVENYYLSIAYGTDLLVGTYKYENDVFLMSNPDDGMPTEIDFIKGEGFVIMDKTVFIEEDALLTTEGEILEGAYYDETGDAIFTFVGNTLVVTTMTDDGTSIVIGRYLIESGLITITVGEDSKSFSIVVGDDYIAINGARYTREDPSSGPSIDVPTDDTSTLRQLLDGTYQKVESDKDERYSFRGNSFVLTIDGEDVLSGKYEIESDTIYLYTDDSGVASASYALEIGNDYISLDGITYGKVVSLT